MPTVRQIARHMSFADRNSAGLLPSSVRVMLMESSTASSYLYISKGDADGSIGCRDDEGASSFLVEMFQ